MRLRVAAIAVAEYSLWQIEDYAQGLSKKYTRVHTMIWALAGGLRRLNVPCEDVELLVRRAGELSGDGERWIEKHITQVRETYERDPSRKMTGLRTLGEVMCKAA